jgi:hypothetical protein
MNLRRTTDRARRLHSSRALFALSALAVVAALAVPAAVGAAPLRAAHHTQPVHVRVLTPSQGGRAGAGGVFNVDLSLRASSHNANGSLSAAAGYRPFFNNPGSATFGPGMPDPGAPGLVVLLSTTPAAAGGPNANLAGVFQLNAIERVHGLIRTFNDWQVGVPGFFGTNVNATLTVFVVQGTAPGIVDMSNVHPISNVAHVDFHIAS